MFAAVARIGINNLAEPRTETMATNPSRLRMSPTRTVVQLSLSSILQRIRLSDTANF